MTRGQDECVADAKNESHTCQSVTTLMCTWMETTQEDSQLWGKTVTQ